MEAANFTDNVIQQSHTTSKELNFHIPLNFRTDNLSWERKLELEIHRTNIWNWDWDRILKRKFIYGNRYLRLTFLKYWPYENEGFAFISVHYISKFKETVYETWIKTEFWKVNLNMEIANSKKLICNVNPTKMRVLI